jgi:thiol-disulfide isomerase/thioredoxin
MQPRRPPDSTAWPRRRAWLIGLSAASLGAAAISAAWRAGRDGVPQRLPDLSYPLIDGRRLTPADLAGRVVLVNFWATTCGPCVAGMPDLVRVHEAYRSRGFELIAVAMPYDRPDHVLHFAGTRRLPFPVALDPMGAAVAAWGGVQGTPLSWLVAPDGRVVNRWFGKLPVARLKREIEALLPAPA